MTIDFITQVRIRLVSQLIKGIPVFVQEIKPSPSILTSTSIHTDYKQTNINGTFDGEYAE